ncbi:unnamed protein product [Kluyveromyces dobzhanskii CBS 2104]|uniref:Golgi apparatus membrane protein TVP38 n=1 Tax=Kluyveromyces dobzhanskii CBS 2104 TaxID=1427455 RepID=A0A0A8KYZ0_9SACH|nr:unnamed protein product [Kluyveromyces dobzhanskii CBS 2104]
MADTYEARVSLGGMRPAETDFLDSNDNFDDLDDDFLDIYNMSWRQRVVQHSKRYLRSGREKFYGLSKVKKTMVVVLCILEIMLIFVTVVKREAIMKGLVDISNDLRQKWYAPPVLLFLIVLVSFPPVVGYTFLSLSTGLIYGVSFKGWFILATSTLIGSVLSFTVFQKVLHSHAERLIRMNSKLEAVSSVLQANNSYWMIAMIRLCPFPYSFTNGALAAIYGISIKNFAIANIVTSPKVVIYLFVGERLKNMGETDSNSERLINFISIIVANLFLVSTTWLLYYRFKKRYLELQAEQQNSFDVF